ncbi:cation:proton antiporter [Aestuariibius sp. 2305UL40-4]|uniref:cation:proton antiporter domain-containing protein n=1 Tax=Aestuariibius violaceus TaxID=3234132 RepID=UPI00345E59D9
MTEMLTLALIFLVAGVIMVPIASRLGLGSVLGYLIAGILLSPLLSVANVDVVEVQHFAEFGVVMMLFLVGLELEPRVLWQMRYQLVGLGGLQVLGTGAAIAGIAVMFGQPWNVAIAIGAVLSLSSTAIVLKTLTEKGLLRSRGGQSSFSVLLTQDIAVIPMLAFLPFLAMPELAGLAETGAEHGAGHGEEAGTAMLGGIEAWIAERSGWERAGLTIGAIASVILVGSYLTRPVFGFIAKARLQELFTATALTIVVGIAVLMTMVGLSPALGTFLAGVVLANSEYRHELEADLEPFRGLLLGLFFITVGAGINFPLLWDTLGTVLALTLGLVLVKGAVLYLLAVIFQLRGTDRWLFTLSLAQAGEFGFVLLSFATANAIMPRGVADQLLLIVALSMLVTPLLFIIFDRAVAPRFSSAQEREPDEIDADGPIIIAGHGRFGGVVNRILTSAGYKTVVLDNNISHLEMLRAFGFRVFYGDPTRPDLLHAAGIENARLLVVAIDDPHQTTELVRYVSDAHPHVHVTARAQDRNHVYELWAAGCRDIIRDTFDSAVRTGRSALEALGYHPFDAERQVKDFVARDQHALRRMADLYDPETPSYKNDAYVARARELMKEQDEAMQQDSPDYTDWIGRAWVPPSPADQKSDAEAADEAERKAS